MVCYSWQPIIRLFWNPPAKKAIVRGGPPAAAKMVLFVTIIHVFHPLAIATKSRILDAMFTIYFSNL